MAAKIKEKKIVISLRKNLDKKCHFPCLISFTEQKEFENVSHYLVPSDNSQIAEFLKTFNLWFTKSKDNPLYAYHIHNTVESICFGGSSHKTAKKYWNLCVSMGWRPVKEDS